MCFLRTRNDVGFKHVGPKTRFAEGVVKSTVYRREAVRFRFTTHRMKVIERY